ncbi:peptide ABC transporter substrate-binding protein [Crassaminicella indica]|uniref:Peptide ABC transporter substrate-binding protein n=1 Tax=Crassaminicella indica TaxID=2855394 RepID=A0ABX8RDJ1_9CLOT|nr:peptide ABC transporter substrate-binding protein [Crassaminicella indica]QXM06512.1 peptide ABC transporter substrate-binding protein [Crassaminicella indica]
MSKKFFVLFLVMILIITVFTGCVGSSDKQKEDEVQGETKNVSVLRWNLRSEPKTIDPQLNSASDGGHVINNIFEGLMREIDGKLISGMAESYDVSDDGLTYTFHLRDAKWSDGKPVRAQDFEYAWKRALDPNLVPEPSEYAFQLFYIKGAQDAYEGKGSLDDVSIKCKDDKTLEVTLSAPTPYFLDLTTFYTYMPVRKDMVEKDPEGWARNPELAVSNGPFSLENYIMGDRIILKKNKYYWNADKVKLDKIKAMMIVEESTALTAYEAGELDVIDQIPVQEIPRLKKEDPTFMIWPEVGTYYYIFNVNAKPVDDIRVRRALTLAIDRKTICEEIAKGGELPATGFTPPGLLDAEGKEFQKVAGDYGIDPNDAKVEEAKKLLAEAGYPDGKGFPEVTVIYNTLEKHKAIAEAIQEMWRQNLGIEVKLQNQEWAVFQDARHHGNFQIARAGWLGDYADPMTMLDLWLSYSGNNDCQWNNPEYDKLIEKSKLLTGKERFELLYKAQALMMDTNIVMPIYYYTRPQMVKEYVKDWQKTKMGHWFFGYVSIER